MNDSVIHQLKKLQIDSKNDQAVLLTNTNRLRGKDAMSQTLIPSSIFSPPYTSIPGSRRPISPKNFLLTTNEQPIMAGVLREGERGNSHVKHTSEYYSARRKGNPDICNNTDEP